MKPYPPSQPPPSRAHAFFAVDRLRALDIESLLPLLLALSGFVAVLPFVAIRSIQGHYPLAIVNVVITLTFAWVAWSLFRGKAVRLANAVMSLMCVSGLTANIYFNGSEHIYWAFPLLVSLFFLLKPKEAIGLITVASLAALPPLMAEQDSRITPVLFFSLVLTVLIATAFSALTLTQRRRMRAMALMDPLTGTSNRRAMDETIAALIDRPESAVQSLTLIMLDIDHFKNINDEFGHAAGDRVLIAVAECIRENVRASDHCFRVGGEEFVVVVEGAGLSVARRLSESLRAAVSALQIPSCNNPKQLLQVTVSLGVAELLEGENADQWYKRADGALYEAKRAGRNRTFLAGEPNNYTSTGTWSPFHGLDAS
ncbi:MAG: GGDEF domain-containing protein [Pseudomonadota bacterium]